MHPGAALVFALAIFFVLGLWAVRDGADGEKNIGELKLSIVCVGAMLFVLEPFPSHMLDDRLFGFTARDYVMWGLFVALLYAQFPPNRVK